MAWPSRVAGVAEAGTVLGHARGFLDFYAGVFSLVALSLTVMGGLLAMDRLVLRPPHRVRLQLLHRGVATAAVGFLAVPVALRVVDGHVGGRTAAMGAGTLAALLMVVLAASGIARGRFAYRTRPGVWRGAPRPPAPLRCARGARRAPPPAGA